LQCPFFSLPFQVFLLLFLFSLPFHTHILEPVLPRLLAPPFFRTFAHFFGLSFLPSIVYPFFSFLFLYCVDVDFLLHREETCPAYPGIRLRKVKASPLSRLNWDGRPFSFYPLVFFYFCFTFSPRPVFSFFSHQNQEGASPFFPTPSKGRHFFPLSFLFFLSLIFSPFCEPANLTFTPLSVCDGVHQAPPNFQFFHFPRIQYPHPLFCSFFWFHGSRRPPFIFSNTQPMLISPFPLPFGPGALHLLAPALVLDRNTTFWTRTPPPPYAFPRVLC